MYQIKKLFFTNSLLYKGSAGRLIKWGSVCWSLSVVLYLNTDFMKDVFGSLQVILLFMQQNEMLLPTLYTSLEESFTSFTRPYTIMKARCIVIAHLTQLSLDAVTWHQQVYRTIIQKLYMSSFKGHKVSMLCSNWLL